VSAQTERVFVDTNILIYAYENEEGAKQKTAKRLLSELWDQRAGVVSTQVLAEFYYVATRKLKMPRAVARKIVAAYGHWCSADTSLELLVSASLLEEEHRLSWWDALIIQAALLSGADTLLSEDLQHGQRFGELTVRNPFVERN
jgi:predicted nucleic acid-binding protein